MIRLLYLGDYCCTTGFGQVSRNIISTLYKTGDYQVDVIGINYNGDPYDHELWPGNVYPACPGGMVRPPYNDVYGRQRLLDMLASGNYDVCMILQDTFVIKDVMEGIKQAKEQMGTAMVYYYPIDSTVDKAWIEGVVDVFDFPVAYTQFAKEETLRILPDSKLDVIYHGTNLADFYPITDRKKVTEFKQKYFQGTLDNKFVVMNISRNQIRKDIPHSLMAIKEVRQSKPEAILYLHMAETDQGGSIDAYAQQLGLKPGEDYIVPKAFNQGLSQEKMNLLYNMADCVILSTHGEGWGLPVTESFATKTPVVVPNNTSLMEMGADNRATLIPCRDFHTYGMADNCRMRPVVDFHDLAEGILQVMDGSGPDVEGAYTWVKGHTWEVVCRDWNKIMHQAAALTKTRHARKDEKVKPNRAQRRKQKA